MSTYAVFGMTRPKAIDMARKAVDRQLLKSNKHLPESKWSDLVAEKVEIIMASSRCVMLSEKFDAPEFAKDFRKLAQKVESRDLHIKAYCKTGMASLKTGRPIMHWVEHV